LNKKEFIREIPSNPELIPEIEEYIIDIASKENLDAELLNNLALSVSEAIANSIVHGNQSDPTKKVIIKILINEEFLKISFLDEGKGFDPDSIPDPTEPENIFKDHGRGLYIMRNFLTNLSYNFTESGTETVLTVQLENK